MDAWKEVVASAQVYFDGVSGGLKPHPLTEGKFGTSLEFMLAVDFGYLAIVLIGTQIMKLDAMPTFKITYFKMLHNLFLFLLSSYMCLECIRQAVLNKHSVFGNDMAKGTEEPGAGLAQIVWIFYLSKSYEFVDTMIMLATKKFNQISFLHVYHHSTIFAIWSAALRCLIFWWARLRLSQRSLPRVRVTPRNTDHRSQ